MTKDIIRFEMAPDRCTFEAFILGLKVAEVHHRASRPLTSSGLTAETRMRLALQLQLQEWKFGCQITVSSISRCEDSIESAKYHF